MTPAGSYAAYDSSTPLRPYSVERRDPGPTDVAIAIRFCGICHTDLHFVKNDLGMSRYPLVPGHEIVGVVERVGSTVTRFKPGDRVGVGCLVNSCRECATCRDGEEQYCAGSVLTYASDDRDGTMTQGGYSTRVTVDQDFVLRMREPLALESAAPLLCAGITTYSPLRTWGAGPGKQVAVVGLGGLGHMCVKLAAAMGCDVTVISTSDRKREDARRLGASEFLNARDLDPSAAANRFDLILDTVCAPHELAGRLPMLAKDGTIVLLGLVTEPMPIASPPLLFGRRRVAGSLIGGIRETQEMLDFCADHGITSDVEVIPAQKINEAYERLARGDVRFRFVIDTSTM